MKLENNFTIDAPVERAWEALNSPETVAPCFPGATLTNYEGDSFAGTVKIKLGPIAMTYKGKGTYVTRDEDAPSTRPARTPAATARRPRRSPPRWWRTARTGRPSRWSPT